MAMMVIEKYKLFYSLNLNAIDEKCVKRNRNHYVYFTTVHCEE
jgi:hypothetical protein